MTEDRAEETPRVVVRDRRRIDPATGAPREPTPAGDPAVASAPVSRPGDERVADLTETLQRLKAEYDNYRRRVERDRALVADLETARVLAALLPVLDDVERAREHGDLTGAFAAVGEGLIGVTGKLGLERFGEPGEPFDPRVHEALLSSESPDVSEPVAAQVLRPGYRYAGRVLRPAQVAVVAPAHEPVQASAGPESLPPDPGEAGPAG